MFTYLLIWFVVASFTLGYKRYAELNEFNKYFSDSNLANELITSVLWPLFWSAWLSSFLIEGVVYVINKITER